MAVKIGWSTESERTYAANIQYLKEEWSDKEVRSFIQQTVYVLSRLQEHPESSPASIKNKKVRRARINRYITLYYRYYSTRQEIILLSFWHVKQDPGKLKY